MRQAARVVVCLWFFVGGIAHFALTELEMSIVPAWLPAHRLLVLASGGFELLGALGLAWPAARRLAGWGLIALTIAVTPANVYMLQHAELFPAVPYWALVVRLPLQAALIGCIAYAAFGRPERSRRL